MKPQPNFLLVGAAKSGTTSLYNYLDQHPDIFMSAVKEPLFFCSTGVERETLAKELYPLPLDQVVTDFDDYLNLFADAQEERAIGEASVYYLLDYGKTIPNIQRLLPDSSRLKIVIILRNPIDACFSHYSMYNLYLKHFAKDGKTPSFEECIELEQKRVEDGYLALAHFHWFFYADQVQAYLENFDQVQIHLYSELKNDRQSVVTKLFDFLEVDTSFTPELSSEFNFSGVPKFGPVYRLLSVPSPMRDRLQVIVRRIMPSKSLRTKFLHRLMRLNLNRPQMNLATRERLKEMYRDDIIRLQDLINRDLTEWLC